MAIQEFDNPNQAVEPGVEQSPLEVFKSDLHGMVMDVESSGESALDHLRMVKNALRRRQVELMKESYASDSPNHMATIQEQMILIYHKQVWVEGYISDRTETLD